MNEKQIREGSILIVDDQRDAVALLRQMLAKAGYTRLHTTSDSREVIAMCQEFDPDLLILDLHMPTPSGFEIMEQLSAERRTGEAYLPVLVLTADATPMTRLKALSMGAKDFLTKPVDHVDLLLCVRNLVETRLLYRALYRTEPAPPIASPPPQCPADSGDEILAVLTALIEQCDPVLGARGRRVSRICGAVAVALGRPVSHGAQIERASRIFDLGMMCMPAPLRAKSGLLTPSEQDYWRKHATISEQILPARAGVLDVARQIACGHHERWDGDGYPNGFKGDQIPLAARILAASLCYDDLTQEGSSPQQAVDEIKRQGGFAFDPAVAAALESVVRRERVSTLPSATASPSVPATP